jgi:glycosyltransferase involved in cell wall biosynthesis
LVEQTIEYLVYQHFVDTLKWPMLRPILRIDVSKIRYWEEYYWGKATRVVAMSQADREVMQSKTADLHVSIVPNGVDDQFFAFKKKTPQKDAKILFVGNFKWLQNREAVAELVHKIWPLVSKKLGFTKLWIVGKFPTQEILLLKGNRIEVSDNVDDIRQAYEESAILLAPIYGPGGTRYKILEAMATGVPVVTTPQGIEGLGIEDGKEALVRTDAKGLADATIEVLTNAHLYQKLASQANSLVREIYNWSSIAKSLDSIYEEVAHEKH